MSIFEQVTIQQGYYGSQTGNNVCLSAQWLVYGKQYNSKDNPYFCCQKRRNSKKRTDKCVHTHIE